jgi:hypothetical protein
LRHAFASGASGRISAAHSLGKTPLTAMRVDANSGMSRDDPASRAHDVCTLMEKWTNSAIVRSVIFKVEVEGLCRWTVVSHAKLGERKVYRDHRTVEFNLFDF